MRGRLEGVCRGVAWGWAISRAAPEAPATVELLLDGQPSGHGYSAGMRLRF